MSLRNINYSKKFVVKQVIGKGNTKKNLIVMQLLLYLLGRGIQTL